MEPMHDHSGCSRLVFRAAFLPAQHPGSACSLFHLLPASGGAAWLGERRQMIGLGRALTFESTSADAITDVRRVWEGAAAPLPGDIPSPVLFASFAFRAPARSVAFVPALTIIDQAGARWAITAGIDRAPDPLEALNAALFAWRWPCCGSVDGVDAPDPTLCTLPAMIRGAWKGCCMAATQSLRARCRGFRARLLQTSSIRVRFSAVFGSVVTNVVHPVPERAGNGCSSVRLDDVCNGGRDRAAGVPAFGRRL